jgi:hypothetical protein
LEAGKLEGLKGTKVGRWEVEKLRKKRHFFVSPLSFLLLPLTLINPINSINQSTTYPLSTMLYELRPAQPAIRIPASQLSSL